MINFFAEKELLFQNLYLFSDIKCFADGTLWPQSINFFESLSTKYKKFIRKPTKKLNKDAIKIALWKLVFRTDHPFSHRKRKKKIRILNEVRVGC